MTRINAVRNIAETRSSVTRGSVAWGKHTGALIFAAVLIVCSLTVGCSSDNKPQPVTSNQIPAPPTPSAVSPMPAPGVQAATKPAPKKVVARKPATVNYADKTYGVTFEYPRRYAIETGDAAADLLASNPMAMNFVQPGGVALAAVELPETGFANTDFSSAFFDVSVNKSLTADQCIEFAVPQPKVSESQSPQTCHPEDRASCGTKDPTPAVASTGTDGSSHGDASGSAAVSSTATNAPAAPEPASAAKLSNDSASNSKLMLGDLELRATEAVSGEGTRQSDSKYFHVYQNGSCYEFALNVTTDASEEGLVKHVDRDKVFNRLEQILATVKINAVAAPEATAETPTATPAATPAQ
ncbi:MAG: hypothetical protein ACLPHP_03425 [Candidatus Sulfotelmatobacter sp.]